MGLLNGMFSMVKYGLSTCYGGLGAVGTNCNEGDFSRASARLSFSRPYNKTTTTLQDQAESVVGELSTILTSGRLSADNKRLIKDAYISKLNQTGIVDPAGAAIRIAQVCYCFVLGCVSYYRTNSYCCVSCEYLPATCIDYSRVPFHKHHP